MRSSARGNEMSRLVQSTQEVARVTQAMASMQSTRAKGKGKRAAKTALHKGFFNYEPG